MPERVREEDPLSHPYRLIRAITGKGGGGAGVGLPQPLYGGRGETLCLPSSLLRLHFSIRTGIHYIVGGKWKII